MGRILHHSSPKPCHRPRIVGLGPRRHPRLREVVAPILGSRAQVSVMDSELKILNDRLLRALKVREQRVDGLPPQQ